jgi:hypothetical protein
MDKTTISQFKSPKTQALCERSYRLAILINNQAKPKQFPPHLQDIHRERLAELQVRLIRTNIDLLRAHQVDANFDGSNRFDETIANLQSQIDELEAEYGELAA